jgi:MFS family permease
MSLGGIIFITLGGILADINWKVPFLLYFFSLLILPFTYVYLKEPKERTVIQNDDPSMKSPAIIWFVFFNVMIMWILFFIIPIQIPFYLKSIGIEKNAMIGIAIASSTFFSAVAAFSYSKIKDKLSFRQIFSIGYFLMAVAFTCIAIGNSYVMVMLGMLFAGLGMGIMIPNANIWVMQLAPMQIRGKEIGRLTTFWFMGQFLSPLVLLPFLEYFSQSQLFFVISGILLGLSLLFLGSYLLSAREAPSG